MTLNPTHSARLATPPPFGNLQAYLDKKVPGDDKKFCEALAVQLNGPDPWLTLVLGSGCSQPEELAADSFLAVLRRLEVAPSASLSGLIIDDMSVTEVVREFVLDLIKDRLRISHFPTASSGETLDPAPAWLVESALLAALLSRLYFTGMAAHFKPPRRSPHEDEVRLDREDASTLDELNTKYAEPCRQVAQSLLDRFKHDTTAADLPKMVRDTIVALLNSVKDGLSGYPSAITIRAADVHGLSEIVWSWIVRLSGALVYPGWTDLLLDLSHKDNSTVGRVGLPSFKDVEAAQRHVGKLYSDIARTSWQSRGSATSIYRAAAQLLRQQHEHLCGFREKLTTLQDTTHPLPCTPASPHRPPFAVAFSTSFDLELEQVLLQDGRPFFLVLPVHVLASSVQTAVFTVWCVLRVEPTEQPSIESILNPPDHQWQLQVGAKDWLWEGPVIVRLAGCPSIRLPDLGKHAALRAQISLTLDRGLHELVMRRRDRDKSKGWEEDANARSDIERNLAMAHALIMNEYDALLHNSIDQGGQSEPHRLFADFALDSERWTRFWLLLGVQIKDAAFRQRVASLISTLPARGDTLKSQDFPPRRFGLAVNLYSTELEQELLSWSGFDMVKARISGFVPNLDHYREHLVARSNETFKFEARCNV